MGTCGLKLLDGNLLIAVTQAISHFQLSDSSLPPPSLMVRVKQTPHATNKTD
jgi:hypothetical protein